MKRSINYKVLYLLDKKKLLYRKGAFYIANGDAVSYLVSCPLSLVKQFLSKNRIANRLFRLEPRAVEWLSESKFVICFARKIWILDICKKTMYVVFKNRQGWSDVLNFCSDGNSLYWGEYGSNEQRREVNIYRMDNNENISVVYSFPSQSVRHIHNVVFDKVEKYFWIFTGDNDIMSGIYQASNDWKTITPIKTGKQCYRAVIGFPYKGGLIYATDSVTDTNHIYLLSADNDLKDLAIINGSCIYGSETLNCYIFSTTVEPPEGNGLSNLFSYKLGNGIKSLDVHIVMVRKKDLSVKVIASYKKDRWPFKLFQYGSVMFPKGQTQSDGLCYYVMACKNVDGRSFSIDLH